MLIEPKIIEEPPEKLTPETVIYWSRHYKEIMGAEKGKAIATKARIFLEKKCVDYDKDMKVFYVRPIKGYNKSTYTIKSVKGEFTCTCQFYNKVCIKEGGMCSHILAVYLWLKIKNWKKEREEKNANELLRDKVTAKSSKN